MEWLISVHLSWSGPSRAAFPSPRHVIERTDEEHHAYLDLVSVVYLIKLLLHELPKEALPASMSMNKGER